jgi:amino acid transporter
MSTVTKPQGPRKSDEERLREMGYEQSLSRGWSGFSNFAISFSIISVLAGCFTTYGQAYNNGGPIAISWGWPIISVFILIIAFCMAELVSTYPTAGGIYWWASTLGGPAWGWFTGWFNIIGLIAVVASVDYACATFLNALLGSWGVDFLVNFGDDAGILGETFLLFALILTLHAVLNIFSSPLVALFNTVSVWWHVIGVAVIVLVLALVPDQHASADFVFTERLNNSGFGDGMYWFYVLPVGGLLTMYTITGYDASAHVSEETKGAAESAPKGVWRSVAYSAVIGWIVLLAITFAAADPEAGAGGSIPIFQSAMSAGWAELVILISVVGQLFCGMACVTSCSRMTYAFSRDRAVPGWQLWTRLNHHRVPAYAVLFSCGAAALITLPALFGNAEGVPVAFFAVVSIAVIGLYLAYTIPVFLRWRMGDRFEQGPWTLGDKYKWMCPIAFTWVGICTVVFCLPFTPGGVPGRDEFDWNDVNYAPLMVGAVLLAVGIWWIASAHKTFTGPVKTTGEGAAAPAVDEINLA